VSHTWFLAPDEFAKSAYSGGEPYHLLLPDPAADFRVRGMPGIEEHFVDYLRAVFAGAGFHGRTQPCDDPQHGKSCRAIRDHARSHPQSRRVLMTPGDRHALRVAQPGPGARSPLAGRVAVATRRSGEWSGARVTGDRDRFQRRMGVGHRVLAGRHPD